VISKNKTKILTDNRNILYIIQHLPTLISRCKSIFSSMLTFEVMFHSVDIHLHAMLSALLYGYWLNQQEKVGLWKVHICCQ